MTVSAAATTGGKLFGYWTVDGNFVSKKLSIITQFGFDHTLEAHYFSPPSEDDFAQAHVIGGLQGYVYANNFASSGQTGEPANFGRTVWYSWTASDDTTPYVLCLKTIKDWTRDLADPDRPMLNTEVRVFTGDMVGGLTELPDPATVSNPWNEAPSFGEFSNGYYVETSYSKYGTHGNGSVVSFVPAPGATYYIRVDGVGGDVGYFLLQWEVGSDLTPGACDGCGPSTWPDEECCGSAQVTDIFTSPSKASFGNWGAGQYVVRYCHGAMNLYTSEPPWARWMVGDTEFGGSHIRPCFYESGNSGDNFSSAALSGPGRVYLTQAEAERYNRCDSLSFVHSGGEIWMRFEDNPLGDNAHGSPDPIYMLWRCRPVFRFGYCYASWAGDTAIVADFTLVNLNGGVWYNVSADVAISGGVTGSDGPHTFNMGSAGSEATLQFNLAVGSAAAVDLTATLQFNDGSSTVFGALTVHFFSMIGDCTFGQLYSTGMRNGIPTNMFAITPTNSGNLATKAMTVVVTGTNGLQLWDDVAGAFVSTLTQAWSRQLNPTGRSGASYGTTIFCKHAIASAFASDVTFTFYEEQTPIGSFVHTYEILP